MKKIIAIRHENKYEMERRVPIIPDHVGSLINKGYEIHVQSSAKRVFSDDEYRNAGAIVNNDISDADIIFGVKEIPMQDLMPGKTYMFFSHVIKGQPYNMPMLKRLMELKCNLIDYEKVTDEFNKRVIFFGKYAGLAGMINTLWSVGQRYQKLGIETPFVKLRQSYTYNSLSEAKKAISKVGYEIMKHGLPKELQPFTIGITGYGNVSMGAQEILHLLPVKEIFPEDLPLLKEDISDGKVVYKVVFKEQDMVKHVGEERPFDLQHYYQHPEEYKSRFFDYLENMSVLVHGSYWDARYPRVVSKNEIARLYSKSNPKLVVVGDISCDPDGGVEFTHKGTEISDPVFVYNPATGIPAMGFDGDGVCVMSVDILPSELPRDASRGFSDALRPFVESIVECDFNNSYENLTIAPAIKRALILHNGELTKPFEYISKYF
ncbi:MAG TPA: bifunctional lysine ketoglutarate reductase /saccharopine dehydrogenase family protein [Bacteroidales bacterium]|nr:bifunctional lysine ketoglutarate reductase /saccharopine dehydrogenase family protein [Bacteroidales bacterium]